MKKRKINQTFDLKIRNTKVIVSDDFLTTGDTADKVTKRLEECGEKVIGKVFPAKTFNLKQHLQTLNIKLTYSLT